MLGVKLSEEVRCHIGKSFCLTKFEHCEGCSGCLLFNSVLKSLTLPPMYTTLRFNTIKSNQHEAFEEITSFFKNNSTSRNDIGDICLNLTSSIPDAMVFRNTGPHSRIKQSKEIIVDQACGCSVLRGAQVFVQGIVGAPTGLLQNDYVSVYTDVDGLCCKGFTGHFDGPKEYLGNGVSLFSRKSLFCGNETLSGVGINMTDPIYCAPSLDDIPSSLVFPQNLSSIVCGHVLNPKPGDRVLDMCAAPGGKTTHLATIMKNTGTVIALDKNKNKINKISNHASNWGLSCIKAYHFDSTKAVDVSSDSVDSPPFPRGSFDKILLDAPCSALGQRPCFANKIKIAAIKAFPVLQRKLISQAYELLKVDGELLYSTCTITLEENEHQVHWILDNYDDMELIKACPYLGGPGLPSPLSEEQSQKVQRFSPISSCNIGADADTIGFFIAKFVKKKLN